MALLVRRRRRELRHAHVAGVERRHQPLDRAALAGRVPALEQDAAPAGPARSRAAWRRARAAAPPAASSPPRAARPPPSFDSFSDRSSSSRRPIRQAPRTRPARARPAPRRRRARRRTCSRRRRPAASRSTSSRSGLTPEATTRTCRPARSRSSSMRCLELLRAAEPVRRPLVGVGEHAVEHLRAGAAQQHRRVRLLRRLGPAPDRVEVHELAVVLGLVLRPDLLHRLDPLAHELEAAARVGAVVAHLLAVPAGADAEQEAPAREPVERGDLLGGHDRIALDHQADAGAQLDALGRGRRERQRHERVQRVAVLGRQHVAARVGRLAADRDVRVLGDEQRVERPLLDQPGERRRGRSPKSVGKNATPRSTGSAGYRGRRSRGPSRARARRRARARACAPAGRRAPPAAPPGRGSRRGSSGCRRRR